MLSSSRLSTSLMKLNQQLYIICSKCPIINRAYIFHQGGVTRMVELSLSIPGTAPPPPVFYKLEESGNVAFHWKNRVTFDR